MGAFLMLMVSTVKVLNRNGKLLLKNH